MDFFSKQGAGIFLHSSIPSRSYTYCLALLAHLADPLDTEEPSVYQYQTDVLGV